MLAGWEQSYIQCENGSFEAAVHGVTPARVALAWVLQQPGVCAIPRSGNPEHTRDNAAAATLTLSSDDLAELDAAFPPPVKKVPLDML